MWNFLKTTVGFLLRELTNKRFVIGLLVGAAIISRFPLSIVEQNDGFLNSNNQNYHFSYRYYNTETSSEAYDSKPGKEMKKLKHKSSHCRNDRLIRTLIKRLIAVLDTEYSSDEENAFSYPNENNPKISSDLI